ncbi:MAG: hypothetical protein R3C03_09390 [Pirellulaceae bacterium]
MLGLHLRFGEFKIPKSAVLRAGVRIEKLKLLTLRLEYKGRFSAAFYVFFDCFWVVCNLNHSEILSLKRFQKVCLNGLGKIECCKNSRYKDDRCHLSLQRIPINRADALNDFRYLVRFLCNEALGCIFQLCSALFFLVLLPFRFLIWFFGIGYWNSFVNEDGEDHNAQFVTLFGLAFAQAGILLFTEEGLPARVSRITIFAIGTLLVCFLNANLLNGRKLDGTSLTLKYSSWRFGVTTQFLTFLGCLLFGMAALFEGFQGKVSHVDKVEAHRYVWADSRIPDDKKDGIRISFRIDGTTFPEKSLPEKFRVRIALPDEINRNYRIRELKFFVNRPSAEFQRTKNDQLADVRIREFVAKEGTLPDGASQAEQVESEQLANFKYYFVYDGQSDIYYGEVFLLKTTETEKSNEEFLQDLRASKDLNIGAFENVRVTGSD